MAMMLKVRVEGELERLFRKNPVLVESLRRKPLTNVKTQHASFCPALAQGTPESICICVRGIVLRQAY
jgi:hypothetical protein